MNKVVQIWRHLVSYPIPNKAIGLSHSYEMTQRIFSSIHWTCLSLDYNEQSPCSRMSHPWTVDDEPTASTQQGMQAASGVSFLRARHAAALTADTIRAWASCVRGDSCDWEFGEQKKKRRRSWKNCKGNDILQQKSRIKIRLILHRILQLFSTLVKVLE
jgi:hypothetical protein